MDHFIYLSDWILSQIHNYLLMLQGRTKNRYERYWASLNMKRLHFTMRQIPSLYFYQTKSYKSHNRSFPRIFFFFKNVFPKYYLFFSNFFLYKMKYQLDFLKPKWKSLKRVKGFARIFLLCFQNYSKYVR